VHGHPDLAHMPPAPQGGMGVQAQLPNHLAIGAGH
jgi:hypothetical protein